MFITAKLDSGQVCFVWKGLSKKTSSVKKECGGSISNTITAFVEQRPMERWDGSEFKWS